MTWNISNHLTTIKRGGRHAPRITCADGFSMSVQASHSHWCKPESDTGPWTHFEVAYSSQPVPELQPYYDETGIYCNVPANIIEHIIKSHGGVR